MAVMSSSNCHDGIAVRFRAMGRPSWLLCMVWQSVHFPLTLGCAVPHGVRSKLINRRMLKNALFICILLDSRGPSNMFIVYESPFVPMERRSGGQPWCDIIRTGCQLCHLRSCQLHSLISALQVWAREYWNIGIEVEELTTLFSSNPLFQMRR